MKKRNWPAFLRVLPLVCLGLIAGTQTGWATDYEITETLDLANSDLLKTFSHSQNDPKCYELDFQAEGTLVIVQTYANSAALKKVYSTNLFKNPSASVAAIQPEDLDNIVYYNDDQWEYNEEALTQTQTYTFEPGTKLYYIPNQEVHASGTRYICMNANMSSIQFKWAPDESDGSDQWESYAQMEFNTPYSDLQETPVYLQFTPEKDGVLTAVQAGNPMRYHLVTDPSQLILGQECSTMVIGDFKSSAANSVYTINYYLKKGTTYYYNSEYGMSVNTLVGTDPYLTSVTFSWDPEPDEYDFIPENSEEPYTLVANKVYGFKPSMSGILTVSTPVPLDYNVAMAHYFLYTNPSCTNYLPAISAPTDYKPGTQSFEYKFEVEQDMIYFVKVQYVNGFATSNNTNVFFNLTDSPSVALMSITPTPGKIFDTVNYSSGPGMIFDPNAITFESATFTYISEDTGEETTVDITFENPGQNSISYYAAMCEYYKQAKYNTDTYVTISGINYKGTPLTINNLSDNENVSVDNGNLIVHYPTPKVKFEPEEVEWPTIYSYFEAGNAAGIVNLNFSEPLESVERATLIFGEHTYGNVSGEEEDPTVNIPYSIEGSVLTLNFTGIVFDDYDVSLYSKATIMVFGITSVTDQLYPGGAMPLEQVLDFIDEPFEKDVTPDYMNAEASILSPTSENQPENLTEFVIGWGVPVVIAQENNTVEVVLPTGVDYQVIPQTDEDGNIVINVASISVIDEDPLSGIYTIVIPAGIVKNEDGEINTGQSLSFNWIPATSGLDQLNVNSSKIDSIYTITGLKVIADKISDLPSGLYIINGKKVRVK